MSLEFGLLWKYIVLVDLYHPEVYPSLQINIGIFCGGFLLWTGFRFTLKVTASWSLIPGVV